MKKIITLLAILTFVAITNPLNATFTDDNNNSYDVKKCARKFRKKHVNDPTYIDNDIKSENGDIICSGHRYTKSRNAIIDLIEKDGLKAINKNRTTLDDLVPLVVAIAEDDRPLIKFLLQHGANLNEPIKYYYPTAHGVVHTTYYPIEYVPSTEMFEYLQENGADPSPLLNDLDSFPKKDSHLCEYIEKKKAEHDQLQKQLAKTQQ